MMNKRPLSEVLGQLTGSASLCWQPKPTGVFDPQQANKFVSEALDTLYADLLAIIGEDEENLTEFEAYKLAVKLHESNKDIDTRNRLRAEQRKALRVYIYGEEQK
jgi:hypothetical protein